MAVVEELREACETGHTGHHAHVHLTELVQIETAGSTGRHVAIGGREVAVAVGIGAGRSDVGGVENICVDQIKL